MTKTLCKGKKTDYEKARAICQFIEEHMTYESHSIAFWDAWTYGGGNCSTYAMLTAAMLFYAGIPNGYAHSVNHVFNIALCDGRWIMIDSQGFFDEVEYYYPEIEMICIPSNELVFVVTDYTGIKLGQVGFEYGTTNKRLAKKGVTIPSWTKGYSEDCIRDYPNIVIRGTKGSIAEKMVKELGYKKIKYKGKNFTARKK